MAAPKYLGDFAVLTPDKPAVINGTTGASLSYRELEERSNRFAQYLYALGLRRGERIAMLLENHLRCFEGAGGGFRLGPVADGGHPLPDRRRGGLHHHGQRCARRRFLVRDARFGGAAQLRDARLRAPPDA